MLVDFQKAFESVSWTFLNNVLKFFNFGKEFCHWINILNKNIQATILSQVIYHTFSLYTEAVDKVIPLRPTFSY